MAHPILSYTEKSYLTEEERLTALKKTNYYKEGILDEDYYNKLVTYELDDDDKLLLEGELMRMFNDYRVVSPTDSVNVKKDHEELMNEVVVEANKLLKNVEDKNKVLEGATKCLTSTETEHRKMRKEAEERWEKMIPEPDDTKIYKPEQMRKIREERKKNRPDILKKIGSEVKKLFINLFYEEVEGNYER